MSGLGVLSWDWREQPDIQELARLIRDASGVDVRLSVVGTGSDEYAVVVSVGPVGAEAVAEAYERYLEGED